MGASDYVLKLRRHVGHDLIWLPAATAIMTRDDGKLLLLHHSDIDVWVFPGGQVEFGETLENACLRELKEETGIDATVEKLLGVRSGPDCEIRYSNGDCVAYMSAFYHCRPKGSDVAICGDEAKAVGYFTFDEIEKLNTTRWMQALLPDFRRQLAQK